MRVLVLGGAGFLGSHVADALTESGHDVSIFDLRRSDYASARQISIIGDLLNADDVNQAMSGVDVVYNFAGISDIDEAKSRPLDTVRFNVLGNAIALEAARSNRVKRYLFASSVYVYSKAGSIYRSSKQSCELFIDSYSTAFGLDFTILRYGSLYGPRADARNGVYRILQQALDTSEICYSGTGEETREFIHVRDAAELSVRAIGEDFVNRHVVLTGRHPMRVRDLLLMVKEILGGAVRLTFQPPQNSEHYIMTPYSFQPKLGKKVTSDEYVDLGQGLIQVLNEISKQGGRSQSV